MLVLRRWELKYRFMVTSCPARVPGHPTPYLHARLDAERQPQGRRGTRERACGCCSAARAAHMAAPPAPHAPPRRCWRRTRRASTMRLWAWRARRSGCTARSGRCWTTTPGGQGRGPGARGSCCGRRGVRWARLVAACSSVRELAPVVGVQPRLRACRRGRYDAKGAAPGTPRRERDRLYERAEKVGALLSHLGEQLKEAIADVNDSTGGRRVRGAGSIGTVCRAPGCILPHCGRAPGEAACAACSGRLQGQDWLLIIEAAMLLTPHGIACWLCTVLTSKEAMHALLLLCCRTACAHPLHRCHPALQLPAWATRPRLWARRCAS